MHTVNEWHKNAWHKKRSQITFRLFYFSPHHDCFVIRIYLFLLHSFPLCLHTNRKIRDNQLAVSSARVSKCWEMFVCFFPPIHTWWHKRTCDSTVFLSFLDRNWWNRNEIKKIFALLTHLKNIKLCVHYTERSKLTHRCAHTAFTLSIIGGKRKSVNLIINMRVVSEW